MKTNILKVIAVGTLVLAGLGLSACKPEAEGLDPEIMSQLQTPCAGEIASVFREDGAGWSLVVTCVDKKKAQAQKDQLYRGLEVVPPRSDGFNPMDYENKK